LRGIMLAAGIFDPGAAAAGDPASPVAGSLPDVSAAAATAAPAPPGAPVPADREVVMPAGVRLVVRDSGGVPARAAAAVREIAQNDDVVAIVGPIFSDECEAAAREAEALRIPLLTLSNRIELSNDRDYVFRLRLTPEDEVGFLVDYAFDQLGARRFAVLYPATRYGRGMRLRYWDAVVERGGVMVAAAAYDPEATDYGDAIRSMVGFDLLTNREREALKEREEAMKRARRLPPKEAGELRLELYAMLGPENEPLPPIVDFDALFIPDSNDRIQLLVAQLAYHEVQGVQLLGSSEWSDPSLVRVGRQHVRGAVIATPFHHDSPFPAVHAFVTDYESSFGSAPDSFSSHAFDATNLVLLQLAQSRQSRDAVRDGLLRVRDYPGVSGVTSIEADGNARKRPFLLQIGSKGFVSLD
jgi:branched-chain amino acid transport system substrate-binding protein